MADIKPTTYLGWNPSQSNSVKPPTTLAARGWQANEAPLAQHVNYLFWLTDKWINWFDENIAGAVMATTLDSTMRLMGGGTLSYSVTSGVFAWTQPLFLSIPSIPDADNQIAAGNVVVGANQVLYVQANVPVTSLGDITTGTATVLNVVYSAGIAVGQAVTGTGIPANTTVTAVSDQTVTLSQNVTATAQQTPLTYAGTGALTVQAANVATLVPNSNTVLIGRSTATALYLGVNSGQTILRDGEQRRLIETGYHDVRYPTAGVAIAARQAVYVSSAADGRTLGAAYLTDATQANGALRSMCVGFAISAAASGAVAPIVTGGLLGGFTGLTTGALYYLDPATLGGITTTKPTGGNYTVPVGYAADATNLFVRVGSASGAPTLDPSFNSVIVQPVTGNTNTVQLAVRDAGGTNKALLDAAGNLTVNSISSAQGIKTNYDMGHYYRASSSAGQAYALCDVYASSGGNFTSTFSSRTMPFAGSVVAVALEVFPQAVNTSFAIQGLKNGTQVLTATAPANVLSYTQTFAKGLYPFVANDRLRFQITEGQTQSTAYTVMLRMVVEFTS